MLATGRPKDLLLITWIHILQFPVKRIVTPIFKKILGILIRPLRGLRIGRPGAGTGALTLSAPSVRLGGGLRLLLRAKEMNGTNICDRRPTHRKVAWRAYFFDGLRIFPLVSVLLDLRFPGTSSVMYFAPGQPGRIGQRERHESVRRRHLRRGRDGII